uniref:Uncharacterized protein n=1 Tax=Neogobius melanostomus TaxID=47308 RepID=A0A8C6TJK0_9GOBI
MHELFWAGDEDELQSPQADVGDGEDVVVAHVGASGLSCVALKVFAFIPPNLLSRHHEHHNPKDKDHGEPHASEYSGVLVDPTDEGFQCRPVHNRAVLVEPGKGGLSLKMF